MDGSRPGNRTVLQVRVNPGKPRFRFYGKGGRFFIDARSRPEKGMVNREIVVSLGKLLGKEVRIMKGHRNREKQILVIGASLGEIRSSLETE